MIQKYLTFKVFLGQITKAQTENDMACNATRK